MGFFARLFLLCVVLLILAVVGITIFSNTASKIAWNFASPIAIKDWKFNSEGENLLKLVNGVGEELELGRIEVNGHEIVFAQKLPPKQEVTVSFSEVNCVEGEEYSFEIKLYYDSDKGQNIVEEGFLPLQGSCDKEIQEPTEYFSDLKTAFSSLANSARNIMNTGEYEKAREHVPEEKWNKNFE